KLNITDTKWSCRLCPCGATICCAIEKSTVGVVIKIRELCPKIVGIERKGTNTITCLSDLRRCKVIPGGASVIRAGDLSLGHTPAFQLIQEVNIYKGWRLYNRSIDLCRCGCIS